tara:strand:+ start:5230 stop:5664 length:435 start_codon:yes stop_codon:yes gene_type:complete
MQGSDGYNEMNGYNYGYNYDHSEGYNNHSINKEGVQSSFFYIMLFIIIYYVFMCCQYIFSNENDSNELLLPISNIEKINQIKKNTIDFSNLSKKDKECSICLDTFTNNKEIIILKCKHVFHSACIIEWLKQPGYISCPLCRDSI